MPDLENALATRLRPTLRRLFGIVLRPKNLTLPRKLSVTASLLTVRFDVSAKSARFLLAATFLHACVVGAFARIAQESQSIGTALTTVCDNVIESKGWMICSKLLDGGGWTGSSWATGSTLSANFSGFHPAVDGNIHELDINERGIPSRRGSGIQTYMLVLTDTCRPIVATDEKRLKWTSGELLGIGDRTVDITRAGELVAANELRAPEGPGYQTKKPDDSFSDLRNSTPAATGTVNRIGVYMLLWAGIVVAVLGLLRAPIDTRIARISRMIESELVALRRVEVPSKEERRRYIVNLQMRLASAKVVLEGAVPPFMSGAIVGALMSLLGLASAYDKPEFILFAAALWFLMLVAVLDILARVKLRSIKFDLKRLRTNTATAVR